jgi:hypothetical protein
MNIGNLVTNLAFHLRDSADLVSYAAMGINLIFLGTNIGVFGEILLLICVIVFLIKEIKSIKPHN